MSLRTSEPSPAPSLETEPELQPENISEKPNEDVAVDILGNAKPVSSPPKFPGDKEEAGSQPPKSQAAMNALYKRHHKPHTALIMPERTLFTGDEVYRIVQTYSYGVGLLVYTTFVFSTGTLVATALSFTRILQTTSAVIQSAEAIGEDTAWGWASLLMSALQWIVTFFSFIWYHVLCRTCSRENLLRAAVSNCVQLASV